MKGEAAAAHSAVLAPLTRRRGQRMHPYPGKVKGGLQGVKVDSDGALVRYSQGQIDCRPYTENDGVS